MIFDVVASIRLHPNQSRIGNGFYRSHNLIPKILTLIALSLVLFISPAKAAFDLNFNRPSTPSNGGVAPSFVLNSCDPGTSCSGGDGSAFLQEVLNIDGTAYWHNIVGEVSSGFAMEYYTRFAQGTTTFALPFNPDAGGHEQAYYGSICQNVPQFSSGLKCGNATDPLNVSHDVRYSGTGSTNPSRTVFRMIVSDTDMDMEVYKPLLDRKPLITQTVNDGTLQSLFVADMRAISYSDMNTPVPIINNMTLNDPDLPQTGAADFSMAMAEQSTITAGRFKFTAGAGWNTGNGWDVIGSAFDKGTYTYIDSGFDPYTADWKSYFDSSQNSVVCNTGSRRFYSDTCP
jgi:hypothetical protein